MDYLKALEKTIQYIEDHLGEDITVNEVSAAAGYSYYHLTRQFSAVVGESIGSYIRKRRLADASKKLLYTEMRIIDIALENGFRSSEAFSRAFKSTYYTSPQTYRKNKLDLIITAKDYLNPDLLSHRAHNITLVPNIIEMPEIKTAGLRAQTTLRENVIPQLWEKFNRLAHKIPHRIKGGRGFGICEASSEGNCLANMNQDVIFNEVASFEVDSFEGLPKSFVPKVLPSGRFAVFTHQGDLSKIIDTYRYIWGTWFLTTKETLDQREDFESYDQRFLGYRNPDSEVDIYIPLL